MIITMRDVRACNWCRKGAKDFCEANGVDWDTFRTIGVDHTILEATGDVRALTVIQKARENGRQI